MGTRLLLSLILLGFGAAVSAQQTIDKEFDFDIPQQAAHTALTEFAEQADLTLVFPDDVVRKKSANALIGKYTLQEGIDILLAGTGLTPLFSDHIVLSISAGEQPINDGDTMNMNKKVPLLKRLGTVITTAIFATAGSGAMAAADEKSVEEEPFIEEIIVTAEKREESILVVPLTMSAFSGDMIESLGMTNNDDLEQHVPGLQIGNLYDGASDGYGVSIRGIGTENWGETHADLAVANYVDGVYTLNATGAAANNFDVERIEIARGPQGTLNGRNSIAGSISYITTKPTDFWDVKTLLELTDQTTQRINIAGGGPISENLFFRIRLNDYSGDGAQENIGPGGDWDEPDEQQINGQLRFKNDRFDLNVGYTDYEDTGAPRGVLFLLNRARDNPADANFYKWNGVVPAIANCPDVIFDNNAVNDDRRFSSLLVQRSLRICDDLQNKMNTNRSGLKNITREAWNWSADWSITEGLTLRYTGGNSEYFSSVNRDGDGTSRVSSGIENDFGGMIPQDCIDAFGVDECRDVNYNDSENRQLYEAKEESHELQIVTSFDGPMNFVGGLYTSKQETLYQVNGFAFSGNQSWRMADPDALVASISPLLGFLPVSNCQDVNDNVIGPIFGLPGEDVVIAECAVIFTELGERSRSISIGESETRAVFVHGDWDVNKTWRVSGGLRYTKDEKSNLFNGVEINMLTLGFPFYLVIDQIEGFKDEPQFVPNGEWDQIIGNVSVEHTTAGNDLVYGRISTGYRPGAPNQGCCTSVALKPVAEEKLINYEAGFKGRVLKDTLQITAAVFYQDFEDYQIQGFAELPIDFPFPPGTTSPIVERTVNVDDTKIWGAEAEVVWAPNDRWRVSGFYAYLDSEIGNHRMVIPGSPASSLEVSTIPFPHLQINPELPFVGEQVCTEEWVAANGDFPVPGPSCFWERPTDVTGNALPQQPKHKFGLTLQRFIPTEMGVFSVLGTYTHTGERFMNVGNWPDHAVPDYGRFDLRGSWESQNGEWRVTAYVQNVLDDIGLVNFTPYSRQGHSMVGSLTEPRQFGVQIAWQPNPH